MFLLCLKRQNNFIQLEAFPIQIGMYRNLASDRQNVFECANEQCNM